MADRDPSAGWRRHEGEQLLARLRLTYQQRIDWLWQAKLFARRAQLAALQRRAAEDGKRRS